MFTTMFSTIFAAREGVPVPRGGVERAALPALCVRALCRNAALVEQDYLIHQQRHKIQFVRHQQQRFVANTAGHRQSEPQRQP